MLIGMLVLALLVQVGAHKGEPMTSCQGIRVAPGPTALADALAAAPAGATLCLEPGVYPGGVEIVRAVTIQGAGSDKTTLTGARGSVLAVNEDGLRVAVEGVTVREGRAAQGGGLSLTGLSDVSLREVVFEGNHGGQYGGGAIFAVAGQVRASACRFVGNQGVQGGALLLDEVARGVFTGCSFEGNQAEIGGAVRAREGVVATFTTCTFRGNRAQRPGATLAASGSRSRQPEIRIEGGEVADGDLANDAPHPGHVRVKGATVPAAWKGAPGLEDLGGVSYR